MQLSGSLPIFSNTGTSKDERTNPCIQKRTRKRTNSEFCNTAKYSVFYTDKLFFFWSPTGVLYNFIYQIRSMTNHLSVYQLWYNILQQKSENRESKRRAKEIVAVNRQTSSCYVTWQLTKFVLELRVLTRTNNAPGRAGEVLEMYKSSTYFSNLFSYKEGNFAMGWHFIYLSMHKDYFETLAIIFLEKYIRFNTEITKKTCEFIIH